MRSLRETFRGWLQGGISSLRSRSGFLYNVVILSGGTAFGQALVVLASPIITRLYTPQDMGYLSVYISLFSLVVVIASLRYEVAILLPEDDETSVNILALCLIIVVLFTIICGCVVFFAGDQIAIWVNAPKLGSYLWILPASMFGVGSYQVLSFWAIRKNAYIRISQTKLSQSIGQVLTQVGLGLLHVGLFGLLLGDAIGRIGGVGTLASITWRHNKDSLHSIRLNKILAVAKRYIRFPLIATGATLLNSINLFGPSILTNVLYGVQVTGWFSLSQMVLGIPSMLLATSLAQIYIGEAAKITKFKGQEQLVLFKKILRRLLVAGAPVIITIAIAAPFSFHYIFGPNWDNSAIYLVLLSPMFLIQFISSPISGVLDVMERQDLQVIREIIRAFLFFATFLLIKSMKTGPITWIVSYSVVTSISYLINILFSAHAIRNPHGVSNDKSIRLIDDRSEV
jgi:O-antigen/teichoic acid export membrane protein